MGWLETNGEKCGGEACYGICYANSTISTCYAKSVAGFCIGDRQNLLIMLLVMVGINTICYLISLFKKLHITFWTYINDIIANVLFCLLFAGATCVANGLTSQGLPFVLVGAFLGFARWMGLTCVPVSGLCECKCCTEEEGCCGPNKGAHANVIKMHTKTVSQLELQDNIKQILTQPPKVHIQGQTFNTTTIYITHGNTRPEDRQESTKLVSTPFEQEFPYQSWQEDAPSVSVPKGNALFMKSHVHFEESEQFKKDASAKLAQVIQESMNTCESADLYVKASVEGQEDYVLGAGSGNVPCLYSYYSGCCGIFIWFILGFFGLCCPYELIWLLGVTPIQLYSVKKISTENDLRNSYNTPESQPPDINYC